MMVLNFRILSMQKFIAHKKEVICGEWLVTSYALDALYMRVKTIQPKIIHLDRIIRKIFIPKQ